jgi:hypothetical protein
MSISAFPRRKFLRGALSAGGALALPLPLLDSYLNEHGTAWAQGAPLPKRYVTWFFGNGILPPLWVPAATGVGDAWQLSEQLAPLATVKDYLTVVTGLERKAGGETHWGGAAASVTGAPPASNFGEAGGAYKPSIDQIVADVIGNDTPYKSLEVGVTAATPNAPDPVLHTLSHRSVNERLMPEYDPRAVFARLFPTGGVAVDSTAIENLLAVKQSVLDTVLEDAAELSAQVGATDRVRLEKHMDGIRAIEMRLDSPMINNCQMLTAPSRGADEQSEAPAEVNGLMTDLSTLALSCGLTNVASYVFTLPAAHVYFRHIEGMDADFHDQICHLDAGDESSQPRVHTGVVYTMQCFADFLNKLNSTVEGAGTLLDNSLVYSTSCTAWGKTHSNQDWPTLLAGKAGGLLAGNQHHRFEAENLSRILLTIANVMGANMTELGAADGLVNQGLPILAT